jgi:hypothetical protein
LYIKDPFDRDFSCAPASLKTNFYRMDGNVQSHH